MEKAALEIQIIEKLKQVFDPEIPVNVYDLGFIYEIAISDQFGVNIKMTLTAPNCPVAETLPIEVRNAVQSIQGVSSVYVEMVFEPPWDQAMMTDAAKLELGLL
ncbi:MAG: SUF system Fe-S cluster assembly protein [Bacteroidota bacterium]